MPARLPESVILHRILYVLLFFASIIFITEVTFRLQSYLFARKVHSVLSRMEQIQLGKTSKEEVFTLLPEMKPGILWSFIFNGRSNERCPGDACYVLRIQNRPDGMLAKLREKMNYRHDWMFRAAYWLGHRFRRFGAYVEIRAGKVSRYEYSLAVADQHSIGGLIDVQVLGTNRASYPMDFGFMHDYDEIAGFGIRRPSNRRTKTMYVAFTPEAQPEDVRNAFDVHLGCLWNTQGCSADKQLLPRLWEQKIEPKTQN